MPTVLNLLRLNQQERDAFQAAWPEARHIFAPVERQLTGVGLDHIPGYEEADVIIGCPAPQALAPCRKLKWLQTWSAGVDPYMPPGVLPDGAILTSAVGSYGPAVAEHMLSATLAVMKKLHRYRDDQTALTWGERGEVKSLPGATVLLLGTGDIGGHYAAMVKALGAHTIGLNRHPDRPIPALDQIHHLDELDQWLPRCDVVAMSLPETPQTIHLMDARRLALMKPGAILVNAGRGSAVDCLALADALNSGRLWGAALDVTEPEPLPAGHPLWQCPDLLLTPHTAGGDRMDATIRRVAAIALDNLRRYAAGEAMINRMK